jgi:hypothetical protein
VYVCCKGVLRHAPLLLVEGQPEPIHVPRQQLSAGTREGDHIQVEWHDGQVIGVQRDEQATDQARQRIADKLNRLRRGDHLTNDA